jgi:RNA polymerase sigma factor (sigma-70 family)
MARETPMRALPLPARRERFRILYEANYARILGYALRRCPDPEDAADVVSETFLTAWRRLDAVPPEEARLWLYGTARRVLANQRRGRRRRRQLGERLREALGQAASPAPEREGRLGDVASAFACLSDGDREILALAAWEGFGAAELGRVIGCSENAARIRLHRARRRLEGHLQAGEAGFELVKRRAPHGHVMGEPKEDPT